MRRIDSGVGKRWREGGEFEFYGSMSAGPDLSLLSHEQKDALIHTLVAQVAALTARVAELEAKLGLPPKTPDNSSVPPSKGQKASVPSKPRPKANPHAGAHRPLHPNPTRERIVSAHVCQDCGADVSNVAQSAVQVYDRIEIPKVEPDVTRVTLRGGVCPCCARRFKAPAPEGLEPGSPFGPNLRALVIYLRSVQGIPMARLGAWISGDMPFRAETTRSYLGGVMQSYLADLSARLTGKPSSFSLINIEQRYRYNQAFKSIYSEVPSTIMVMLILIPAIMTALGVVREVETGSIANFRSNSDNAPRIPARQAASLRPDRRPELRHARPVRRFSCSACRSRAPGRRSSPAGSFVCARRPGLAFWFRPSFALRWRRCSARPALRSFPPSASPACSFRFHRSRAPAAPSASDFRRPGSSRSASAPSLRGSGSPSSGPTTWRSRSLPSCSSPWPRSFCGNRRPEVLRKLLHILALGLKELNSIRADPILLALTVYTFSYAVYAVATGAKTEVDHVSTAIVDEDRSELSRLIRQAILPPWFQPPVEIPATRNRSVDGRRPLRVRDRDSTQVRAGRHLEPLSEHPDQYGRDGGRPGRQRRGLSAADHQSGGANLRHTRRRNCHNAQRNGNSAGQPCRPRDVQSQSQVGMVHLGDAGHQQHHHALDHPDRSAPSFASASMGRSSICSRCR